TVHDDSNPTEPVDDPLYFRALPSRDITAELGAYVILSDQEDGTQQFPAMVFGADGQLKQSPTFVASEQGYMFDDGTYAILDKLTSPGNLNLYRPDRSLIAVVPGVGGTGGGAGDAVTGDGVDTAFVGSSTGVSPAVITEVNKDTGATGSVWTLPSN